MEPPIINYRGLGYSIYRVAPAHASQSAGEVCTLINDRIVRLSSSIWILLLDNNLNSFNTSLSPHYFELK